MGLQLFDLGKNFLLLYFRYLGRTNLSSQLLSEFGAAAFKVDDYPTIWATFLLGLGVEIVGSICSCHVGKTAREK